MRKELKPEPNEDVDGVLVCSDKCPHYQMDCEEYTWPPEVCLPAVRDMAAELERLRAMLHQRCMHPDYEYETTDGPRKAFCEPEPEGEGWERNIEEGRNGWERFDYHEEAYWRRLKSKPESTKDDDSDKRRKIA